MDQIFYSDLDTIVDRYMSKKAIGTIYEEKRIVTSEDKQQILQNVKSVDIPDLNFEWS